MCYVVSLLLQSLFEVVVDGGILHYWNVGQRNGARGVIGDMVYHNLECCDFTNKFYKGHRLPQSQNDGSDEQRECAV